MFAMKQLGLLKLGWFMVWLRFRLGRSVSKLQNKFTVFRIKSPRRTFLSTNIVNLFINRENARTYLRIAKTRGKRLLAERKPGRFDFFA